MSDHTSFKPTIPDSVVNYCMRKSGFECDDERACVLDCLAEHTDCMPRTQHTAHRRTTHRTPLHNLRAATHIRPRACPPVLSPRTRIGSLTTVCL